MEHLQEGVDALLGAQPAGVEDADGRRITIWSLLPGETRFGDWVNDANVFDIDQDTDNNTRSTQGRSRMPDSRSSTC